MIFFLMHHSYSSCVLKILGHIHCGYDLPVVPGLRLCGKRKEKEDMRLRMIARECV